MSEVRCTRMPVRFRLPGGVECSDRSFCHVKMQSVRKTKYNGKTGLLNTGDHPLLCGDFYDLFSVNSGRFSNDEVLDGGPDMPHIKLKSESRKSANFIEYQAIGDRHVVYNR